MEALGRERALVIVPSAMTAMWERLADSAGKSVALSKPGEAAWADVTLVSPLQLKLLSPKLLGESFPVVLADDVHAHPLVRPFLHSYVQSGEGRLVIVKEPSEFAKNDAQEINALKAFLSLDLPSAGDSEMRLSGM